MNLIERRRGMMAAVQGGGGEEPNYLRFTALQDSSSVTMNESGTPPTLNLEYRINGGNWTAYTYGTAITLDTGDYIEMRNADDTVRTQVTKDSYNYRRYSITGKYLVSGNIMSLLDKTVNSVSIGETCFYNLFYYQNIEQDLSLPFFEGNGKQYTFGSMFNRASITNPLTIKINNPGKWALRSMIQQSMVSKVDVTLTGNIDDNAMFYFCLQTVFTSIHINTLPNGDNIFNGASHCTEFIIDNPTPPTITSSTITGLKADCIIYVPDDSVNAYKAAQYWDARANYIKGISERPSN